MAQPVFILEYEQPFEFDPAVSADYHEVGWEDCSATVTADTIVQQLGCLPLNEQIIASAEKFLSEGSITVEGVQHFRKGKRLIKRIEEVIMEWE